MNTHHVILAIQVLPMGTSQTLEIIEKAITLIQESGLEYMVCPFETVVEGNYNQVMDLVGNVQEACFQAGANELIINLKVHGFADKSAHIADKLAKY